MCTVYCMYGIILAQIYRFCIVTNKRAFLLCVANAEERNDWIQQIRGVVSEGENRLSRQNSKMLKFNYKQRSRPASFDSGDITDSVNPSPSMPNIYKSQSLQSQMPENLVNPNLLSPAPQMQVMQPSQSQRSIESSSYQRVEEEKRIEIKQSISHTQSPNLAVSPDPDPREAQDIAHNEKQREFAPLLQQPPDLKEDLEFENDKEPLSHRIYLLSPYKANKSFVYIAAASDGMLNLHIYLHK